jgi:uncharacterized delta-60 repeat protein
MGAFKKLNKQDVYKDKYTAYKSWEVSNVDYETFKIFHTALEPYTEQQYLLNSGDIVGGRYLPLISKSLKHLYYNISEDEDLDSGRYELYQQTSLLEENFRDFTDTVYLISIPRQIVGTSIRPKSLKLEGFSSDIVDNGEGSLVLSQTGAKVGDVIYTHGLIVVTNATIVQYFQNTALPTLSWKSTTELQTYNVHCRLRDYEFNVSLNPTITSDLEGTVKPVFLEDYFNPYITTVGLYNDAGELLGVGKLGQPLPKSKDTETTILIRFGIDFREVPRISAVSYCSFDYTVEDQVAACNFNYTVGEQSAACNFNYTVEDQGATTTTTSLPPGTTTTTTTAAACNFNYTVEDQVATTTTTTTSLVLFTHNLSFGETLEASCDSAATDTYYTVNSIGIDEVLYTSPSISEVNRAEEGYYSEASGIDGSLDSTFSVSSGTGFSDTVYSLSLQNDSKVVVGGSFRFLNGISRNRLVRLNTDGSIDTTFSTGTGFDGEVFSTSIDSDGKIVVGGLFSSYNGTTRIGIVRLNTDGNVDTAFDIGTGFDDIVFTVSSQSDGKILVGGAFTTYQGIGRNYIVRLNTDGSYDTTFDIGAGFDNTVRTTLTQSDGKIVVGGAFNTYQGVSSNRIVRLNTDGSVDTTFNVGTGFNGTVRTVSSQSDGKILVGGIFTSYNGVTSNRFIRLNTDGSIDTTFDVGTGFDGQYFSGFTTSINTILIQSDNKVVVGGNFTSYNGLARNSAVRLNTDGSLDTTFITGTGFNGLVFSIVQQSDNKLVIGGAFNAYNDTTTFEIARLNVYTSRVYQVEPSTGQIIAISSCPPITTTTTTTVGTTTTTTTVAAACTFNYTVEDEVVTTTTSTSTTAAPTTTTSTSTTAAPTTTTSTSTTAAPTTTTSTSTTAAPQCEFDYTV